MPANLTWKAPWVWYKVKSRKAMDVVDDALSPIWYIPELDLNLGRRSSVLLWSAWGKKKWQVTESRRSRVIVPWEGWKIVERSPDIEKIEYVYLLRGWEEPLLGSWNSHMRKSQRGRKRGKERERERERERRGRERVILLGTEIIWEKERKSKSPRKIARDLRQCEYTAILPQPMRICFFFFNFLSSLVDSSMEYVYTQYY